MNENIQNAFIGRLRCQGKGFYVTNLFVAPNQASVGDTVDKKLKENLPLNK